MSVVDVVVIVLALAFAFSGFRQGLLVSATSFLGFFGGAVVGAQLSGAVADSVEASPVVPLTTRPSWRVARRWSTSESVPFSSTSPPGDIGVTIAVRTRPKGEVVMGARVVPPERASGRPADGGGRE